MRVSVTLVILCSSVYFFFFNDTATTEIYTLSLHDALPICGERSAEDHDRGVRVQEHPQIAAHHDERDQQDRKSTRLNSSHQIISYAVFCLKKKKQERAEYEVALA